jgi:hypothetical protein
MATRRRDTHTIGEYSWILEDDDVAVQGEAAGLDTATGTIRPMGESSTQIAVGFFAESKTGDGVETIRVSLSTEVEAEWLDNDEAPNDADAATIGSEVYAVDGRTVSTLSTGRSKAGRVLDYDADTNKVLVQSGTAVTGPTGASQGVAHTVADRTALKAVAAASRSDGMVVMLLDDGSMWRFDGDHAGATDVAEELILVPAAGDGRWIRADKAFTAKIPIAFGMADGALIWTVPTGFVLRLTGLPFWEVTTGWTGGAASTIGIASTVTGYTVAGDILGGAAGQATAVLGTAGVKPGTVGPLLDSFAEMQAFVMIAGDDLTYEEITSAYTAGAGFVCVPVSVMLAAA